jgi:hypothetical protein
MKIFVASFLHLRQTKRHERDKMTNVGEKNLCIYDDGIRRRDVHDHHWKGWKDEEGGDCGRHNPKLHT